MGLLAACSTHDEGTGSSESAETNNADAQQRISGLGKICSLPDGNADFVMLGGRIAALSSCGKADTLGQGGIFDLEDPKFFIALDKTREVRHVRFSEDGAFTYFAAIDRAGGAGSTVVHVRSADGKIQKDIQLFDPASTPDLMGFDVRFSPDGKTAVAYGDGRLAIASLDTDSQKVLPLPSGIAADADVTFSPSGDRLLILSKKDDKQTIYDVSLGEEPEVTESPSWILDGAAGDVTVVPGSFDGKSVVRFDTDPASKDGAGFLSLAHVDGSHIELSKDAHVTSHAAAALVFRGGGNSAYLFPGVAADATTTSLLFYATDTSKTETIATDATNDGQGFARAFTKGLVAYPAKDGVAMFDLNSADDPKLIAKNAENKVYTLVNLAEDGKAAIVETAAGYATIDVATGKETALTLPATNGDCGYDLTQMFMSDGIVNAFGALSTKTNACAAHEKTSPEVFSFDAKGAAKSIKFEKFDPTAKEPKLAFPAVDRATLAQCGLEGDTCAVYIEVPAGREAADTKPAPAPTKPKPTTAGDDDDDSTIDSPDDDGSVVVTKRPKPTNGATTGEAPAVSAPPTTKNVTSAACSSAPGATGSSGFGLAFLLGLVALKRRRR